MGGGVVKRGTPEHPKTYELASLLGIRHVYVLGHLELLFHFTAQYAPEGNIGRYSDKRIAAGLEWAGSPQKLIDSLVAAGWVDRDDRVRLVVHDWNDHADRSTIQRLARQGKKPIKTERQRVTDRATGVQLPCDSGATRSKHGGSSDPTKITNEQNHNDTGNLCTRIETKNRTLPEPEPVPTVCSQNAHTQPEPEPHNCHAELFINEPALQHTGPNQKAKGKPEIKIEIEHWFEAEFWPAYWLHKAKQDALRSAHNKAKTPELRSEIMTGLRAQEAEMLQREPEHRPHAATWLNGERWRDEPSPAALPAKSARQLQIERL